MITDDYGNGIKHNRSQTLTRVNSETFKKRKEQRKKYYQDYIFDIHYIP